MIFSSSDRGITITSVQDENGNSLTDLGTSVSNIAQIFILWHSPTGATSYKITVSNTAADVIAVLGEYSGVGGFGNLATHSGFSTTQTISVTTSGHNSVVAAALGISSAVQTQNASVGNLRVTETIASTMCSSLVDNTMANSGVSLTNSLMLASAATYAAVAVELLASIYAPDEDYWVAPFPVQDDPIISVF